MSLIIAATDFSQVSEHAVDYACRLAVQHNADIAIIHAFMIPVMFSDVPMPGSIITDTEKDAEDQMQQLTARMAAAHPGLAIDGKVLYGSVIDALEDYAQDRGTPWLVVLGSAGPEATKWPDSSLMDTFRKLAYPVLAVPRSAAFTTVRNLCFAFDNKHTGNSVAISSINNMAAATGAALHVVNIQPDNSNATAQQIDVEAKALLAPADPQYHFVYGAENVDKGISDFISTNDIDWLIMIPRRHSFFEGLFHKSHTKAVTTHSHIPILAVHETEA